MPECIVCVIQHYKMETLFNSSLSVFFLECIAPRPLGVESFRILDSQFSSSSDYGPVIYASHNGRLNNIRWNNQYGCWLPQHSDSNPWLQVDFLWMVTVTEIWTQGRGTRIIQYKNCWTKTYKVSYGYNGEDFQFYTENNVEKVRQWAAIKCAYQGYGVCIFRTFRVHVF